MDAREVDLFKQADAVEGETMIVFDSKPLALRYVLHRKTVFGESGLIPLVEDTRTGTGLCVIWRSPVAPAMMAERLANCRWMLEEVLAGRQPRPAAGQVNVLWGRRTQ